MIEACDLNAAGFSVTLRAEGSGDTTIQIPRAHLASPPTAPSSQVGSPLGYDHVTLLPGGLHDGRRQINNPDFNSVEFDGFREQAGFNSFMMTSKEMLNNQAN